MKQLVALERERLSENEIWTDFFKVINSEDPEQLFRNAIKEYLLTEDGTESIKGSSEDFNWGDSVMYVPEAFWNKHGIHSVKENESVVIQNPITIRVNQDEILIPDEYWEIEEE